MEVTIIASKICYGEDGADLRDYIAHVQAVNPSRFYGFSTIVQVAVPMTDDQFVRFKNAGRRHANDQEKLAGMESRARENRTGSSDLQKWDVSHYAGLTGRSGPWGGGAKTNRDHMTAHSSNLKRKRDDAWPGEGDTDAQVKAEALAITVSGQHHRIASWTYGGRTKTRDAPGNRTRMDYGAERPTESFRMETEAMLQWKSNHSSNGVMKNTLRLEMVGAYAYMYAEAASRDFIRPSMAHDLLLLRYLRSAVLNDDGVART